MKTNEQLKMVFQQVVTQGIEELMQHLQTIEEGDFQGIEQSVMSSILSVGRGWLEEIMNAPRAEQPAPARRQGTCGHRQRLVGTRPKTVVTLLGKVTVRRAYYQCLQHAQEPSAKLSCACS